MRITRLPDNVNFQNKNIKYQASYRKEGLKVFVVRHYEANHPQAVCGNADNELEKSSYSVLQRDLRGQIFYE